MAAAKKAGAERAASVEGQEAERPAEPTVVVSERTKRLQARGQAALEQSRAAEAKAAKAEPTADAPSGDAAMAQAIEDAAPASAKSAAKKK